MEPVEPVARAQALAEAAAFDFAVGDEAAALTKLAEAHEKTPYDDIFEGFMRRAKRRYADVDT